MEARDMTDDEREPVPDRTSTRERMERMRLEASEREAADIRRDAAELRDTLARLVAKAKDRGTFTGEIPDTPEIPREERIQAYEQRVIAAMGVLSREQREGPDPRIAWRAERERLAGSLARSGDGSFAGYDPGRHPAAARALDAMRTFAADRGAVVHEVGDFMP